MDLLKNKTLKVHAEPCETPKTKHVVIWIFAYIESLLMTHYVSETFLNE